MRYEKNDIIELIQRTVYEVTRVHVNSAEVNLLDTGLGICPADFLYIFDLLEKELEVPAVNLLMNHSYRVMQVDRLSDAMLKLLESGAMHS